MAVVTRVARRSRRFGRLSWGLAIVPLAVVFLALAIAFAADQLYADTNCCSDGFIGGK